MDRRRRASDLRSGRRLKVVTESAADLSIKCAIRTGYRYRYADPIGVERAQPTCQNCTTANTIRDRR